MIYTSYKNRIEKEKEKERKEKEISTFKWVSVKIDYFPFRESHVLSLLLNLIISASETRCWESTANEVLCFSCLRAHALSTDNNVSRTQKNNNKIIAAAMWNEVLI